jgi:hypothetical protein
MNNSPSCSHHGHCKNPVNKMLNLKLSVKLNHRYRVKVIKDKNKKIYIPDVARKKKAGTQIK